MRARTAPVRPDYTARAGEPVMVFREADGSFAIGLGRVVVVSDDIVFVNGVAGDLGRLAHSAEGDAVLREGDAVGYIVRIRKSDPPTEPTNGWILSDNIADAKTMGSTTAAIADNSTVRIGAGCGSTIFYDPADWPRRGDPRSPASSEVLLRLLRQANLNATGRSEPGGGCL
jgi:hypothetical protein